MASHAAQAERGTMAAPTWVRWILAVAMIAVAAYHLSRLTLPKWWRNRRYGAHARIDVELTHAAMGSAMTLMVLGAVAPAELRNLGLLFLAPALWFTSHAVSGLVLDGPRGADVAARQVVGCAAMSYMLVILAGSSAGPALARTVTATMSGMSMSGAGPSSLTTFSSPLARLIAVVAVLGLCAWTIARVRGRCVDAGPALGVGCQLAVNVTTIYMLVAM
jgi:hypothetical protein